MDYGANKGTPARYQTLSIIPVTDTVTFLGNYLALGLGLSTAPYAIRQVPGFEAHLDCCPAVSDTKPIGTVRVVLIFALTFSVERLTKTAKKDRTVVIFTQIQETKD